MRDEKVQPGTPDRRMQAAIDPDNLRPLLTF
jgi:hypothetical protein